MSAPINRLEIIRKMADPDGGALFFMKAVAPQYYDLPFGVHHKNMVKKLLSPELFESGVEIGEILIARDFGKTKVAGVGVPIYSGMFKDKHYIITISASEKKAKQSVNDMKNIIEGRNFKKLFGDCKGDVWSATEIHVQNPSLGIDFCIDARGYDGQLAGFSYKQYRPDLVIIDDLEDIDSVLNKELVDKNMRKLLEVIKPGVSVNKERGGGIIYVIGTIFHTDCVMTRLMDFKNEVKVIRYPALVDTEELSQELGIPMGNSIWEEKYPTELLLRKRDNSIANGYYDVFLRQYMLVNKALDNTTFDTTKIRWLNNPIILQQVLEQNAISIYILVDLAYKTKSENDKTGICVVGYDAGRRLYLLEEIEERMSDVQFIKIIFDFAKKYEKWLQMIGIESYAYTFVKKHLYDEMVERGMDVPLGELKAKGRKKKDRIKALIPYVETGRVFMKPHMSKVKSSMDRFASFGTDQVDDAIDAFAYILDVMVEPDWTEEKTAEDYIDETNAAYRREKFIEFKKAIDLAREAEEEGFSKEARSSAYYRREEDY